MRTLFCCALCLLLSGCPAPSGRQAVHSAQAQKGFVPHYFHTSAFTLFGLLRPAREGHRALHVYIEGDGHAWTRRDRPSANPTPRRPVSLWLARAAPTQGAVLYLARPCQYVTDGQARLCSPKYWTSARPAPEVLQSLNEAITEARERTSSSAGS